jgi:hypothetical protein
LPLCKIYSSPLQFGFDEGGGGGFGAIFRYYKGVEFPYVWRFVLDEKAVIPLLMQR